MVLGGCRSFLLLVTTRCTRGYKGACDRKAATIKVHMRFTKMSHTPFWGINLSL